MSRRKVKLFGIDIDPLTFEGAVETITAWTRSEQPARRLVLTPNVNHVVLFSESSAFRDAYAGASLVLADGRYVVHASRLLGKPLPACVNGSDLVPAVFDRAAEDGRELRVFLLGAMEGVAEVAAHNIERRWPAVSVVGTACPPWGFEDSPDERQRLAASVNAAAPDLLVVGLSPPKQELWLAEYISGLDVNVAIGAGATIDFIAGEKQRAPAWMQRASLEWVHRICVEPRRLAPRYFRDGLKFVRLAAREHRGAARTRIGGGEAL